MSNFDDFRQLVSMWINSDKNPDRAALSLWKYARPRTITDDVAHLDALPAESVIRTPQGYTLEKLADGWYRAGLDYAYTPNPLWLPATVLHEPTA